ncbi:5-(carboxyamino)imidazole ribonucleotide synthase [Coralliovum pocilloporae]|uniref:5-(carboxyamino)imidazole ribonucleotide synthase n=1 Tax=Coralliovum pocilloporae TaxID=3066369 RepID=UPI003306DFD9
MKTDTAPLTPGSTIGMLGGGQLGRMMALAAARLGLDVHVYCPDENSPAFSVAKAYTCAAYEDETSLITFAQSVDVVTYEFENVPSATAELLAQYVPVRPGTKALDVCQDRLTEKTFISSLGIEVAPFADIASDEDLLSAADRIGLPAILKTRRFGYDGKGQTTLRTRDDLTGARDAIGGGPAILEGFVPFEREVSIIAARNPDGQCRIYDIAENRHENHILRETNVPANISPDVIEKANTAVQSLMDELGYIGVIAVELFLVREEDGDRLVVNEIAPRVHNSGHWTEAVCPVDQFEQHIRAVAGWPLGQTERLADVVMTNILGSESNNWQAFAADPDTVLHLYGKAEPRDGRKMGHMTRIIRSGEA